MMRVRPLPTILVVATLGCAAAPVPVVPDRCVCPPPAGACSSDVAADDARKDTIVGSYRDTDTLHDSLSAGDLKAAIFAEGATACMKIAGATDAALATLEPDVAAAIDTARATRAFDDGSSATERELRAWQVYDAAIDAARDKLARIVVAPLTSAVFAEPRASKAIDAAIVDAYGKLTSNAIYSIARNLAETHARVIAKDSLVAASDGCATMVIDAARARWFTALRRKTTGVD